MLLISRKSTVKSDHLGPKGDGEGSEISIHPDIWRGLGPVRQLEPPAQGCRRFVRSGYRRIVTGVGKELQGLGIRERRRAAPPHDRFLRDQTKKSQLRLAAENQV